MSDPSYDDHLDNELHRHLGQQSDLDRDYDNGALDRWILDEFGPQVDAIRAAWKHIKDGFYARYGEGISDTYNMDDVLEMFPEPEKKAKKP